MSVAAELDLAIKQIDDLLSTLQAKAPAATAPPAKEPNTSSSRARAHSADRRPHAALSTQNDGSPAAKPSSSTQAGGHELFAKANLQVARVVSVEENDSVKLYKCLVELSSGVTKQVMAGLKQHTAKDDLLHSLVVVIINLKAAKLAGELSEAMILAAQALLPDDSNAELVKVLQPPEGSEPGDAIYLEGQAPGTAFPKTLKSEFWKKIVADLTVHSHTACFAKQKLVTDKGAVHLDSSVPDGAGIH